MVGEDDPVQAEVLPFEVRVGSDTAVLGQVALFVETVDEGSRGENGDCCLVDVFFDVCTV